MHAALINLDIVIDIIALRELLTSQSEILDDAKTIELTGSFASSKSLKTDTNLSHTQKNKQIVECDTQVLLQKNISTHTLLQTSPVATALAQ